MLKAGGAYHYINRLIVKWQYVGISEDNIDTFCILEIHPNIADVGRRHLPKGTVYVLGPHINGHRVAQLCHISVKEALGIGHGSWVHGVPRIAGTIESIGRKNKSYPLSMTGCDATRPNFIGLRIQQSANAPV